MLEHRQRLTDKDYFKFMGEKDHEQIKKCLKSFVFPIVEKKQEKKQEKPKPLHKIKKCKVCGSELQYLTEWKKHLVCPTCGGKERNYVSKKQ